MKAITDIFAFGDSITYGAADEEGGWITRLRNFLEKTSPTNEVEYYHVYNLGVPGDTSEDILKRFKQETLSRIKKAQNRIFIFGMGGNDSSFYKSKNNHKANPEKFRENVIEIIRQAREFSSVIIFIGLFPCNEEKTSPALWNKDHFYKIEYLTEYNTILKQVCIKEGVYFVDILDYFLKKDYRKLLVEDGLHPNNKGHKEMFEIIKDYLLKNKII